MNSQEILSKILEVVGIENLPREKYDAALSILKQLPDLSDYAVKVLWYRQIASGDVAVLRVYTDDERAKEDYDLAKLDPTKEWYLSVACLIR